MNKLKLHFLWMCLALFSTSSPALPAAMPETQTHVTLPHPVPYFQQSTNDTCWLACACMVCGYYGQKIDEQTLSDKVGRISTWKRLLKETTGKLTHGHERLSGDERACLIALSQNGGLEEFAADHTLGEAGHVVHDVGNMASNATVNVEKSMPTNGTGNVSATGKVGNTGQTNEAIIWNLHSVNLDVVKLTEAVLYLNNTSKAQMAETLLQALASTNPAVIICNAGDSRHAMVAVGVKYPPAMQGAITNLSQFTAVEILDPAPEAGSSINVMSGSDLQKQLNAVYTLPLARQYLAMERQSLALNGKKNDSKKSFFSDLPNPFSHN